MELVLAWWDLSHVAWEASPSTLLCDGLSSQGCYALTMYAAPNSLHLAGNAYVTKDVVTRVNSVLGLGGLR